MKIVHFADLHLGVESYGRPDPATGLSTRLLDFLATFDELVDFALENGADLVVFCGDAYRSREPTQTQQREFARRIHRLASAGVPVFLLVGNHDLPNAAGRATSLEIYATLDIPNVYVGSRPDVYRIATPAGEVQVVALPWPRRSALLAREETRQLDLEQIDQQVQAILTGIISTCTERLDPSLPAILAAHVWVSGARVGSEHGMTLGHEHALLLSNIANPAFDYVALGHVHRQQVLSEDPPVVYAGSLERLDFGEEGDEKGFYVVDIEPGEGEKRRVSYRFCPVAARRFLTLEVTLKAEDPAPTETVLAAIRPQLDAARDAVVRLHITLPAALEGQVNDSTIRDALSGAYSLNIARDIHRETRLRLGDRTAEGITPIEALRAWLETRNVPTERARVLLEHGERLIRGEETADPPEAGPGNSRQPV